MYFLDICSPTTKESERIKSVTIKKYSNIKWSWDKISSRYDLTWEFVESLIDRPWDWNVLVKNKNIIKKYLEYEKQT